jgi:hypothetical protein
VRVPSVPAVAIKDTGFPVVPIPAALAADRKGPTNPALLEIAPVTITAPFTVRPVQVMVPAKMLSVAKGGSYG